MANQKQPSKASRTAHPIKSHTLRLKLIEQLKKQDGEPIAFGAQIIMHTGMRPSQAIKLKYEDIPSDGIITVENSFANGASYTVALPPQLMAIYQHLLNQHNITDYIFQPYCTIQNINKAPAPIDSQTFARKIKYALREANINAEEGGMYVALSLQRTFLYDTYMAHGIEYTQKLLGFKNVFKVYKMINVQPEKNPSWADATNYSPKETCYIELEKCHRLLRYVTNLLDTPKDELFYQLCVEKLQTANVGFDIILRNAPQENPSDRPHMY